MTHSDPQERRANEVKRAGDGSPSAEKLALMYQGLLTGIVRMQAGRQHVTDGEAFRRRTKAVLKEIEDVAVSAGYDGRDVRETHFAVVAFLDSVVLNSNDPIRAEWERKSLQEELFGQTDAGVVFFEKLEHFRSRRDSDQLADLLEVYLLCLLLGFQGRYSGALRGELDSITERLRMRIEDIRGPNRQLSPSGYLPADSSPPPAARHPDAGRFRLAVLAAVVLAIACFLILKAHLIWAGARLRSDLF